MSLSNPEYLQLAETIQRNDYEGLSILKREAERRGDLRYQIKALCFSKPERGIWKLMMDHLMKCEDALLLSEIVEAAQTWLEPWPDVLRRVENYFGQKVGSEVHRKTMSINKLSRCIIYTQIRWINDLTDLVPSVRRLDIKCGDGSGAWEDKLAVGLAKFIESCTKLSTFTMNLFFEEGGPSVDVMEMILQAMPTSVRTLKFICCELGDDLAEIIARADHLKNLQHLRIEAGKYGESGSGEDVEYVYFREGGGLSLRGIQTLSRCKHLKSLRELELVCCEVGTEGGRLIAQSPYFSNLVAFRMFHREAKADLGKGSPLKNLMESPYFSLTHIEVEGKFSPSDIINIIEGSKFPHLESLVLSWSDYRNISPEDTAEKISSDERFVAFFGLGNFVHTYYPSRDNAMAKRVWSLPQNLLLGFAASEWGALRRGAWIILGEMMEKLKAERPQVLIDAFEKTIGRDFGPGFIQSRIRALSSLSNNFDEVVGELYWCEAEAVGHDNFIDHLLAAVSSKMPLAPAILEKFLLEWIFKCARKPGYYWTDEKIQDLLSEQSKWMLDVHLAQHPEVDSYDRGDAFFRVFENPLSSDGVKYRCLLDYVSRDWSSLPTKFMKFLKKQPKAQLLTWFQSLLDDLIVEGSATSLHGLIEDIQLLGVAQALPHSWCREALLKIKKQRRDPEKYDDPAKYALKALASFPAD